MEDGQIRMRALRYWRNAEHEGFVEPGREFSASELRARDLEISELAVRIIEPSPRVVVHEDPAWGLSARPATPDPPKARRRRKR